MEEGHGGAGRAMVDVGGRVQAAAHIVIWHSGALFLAFSRRIYGGTAIYI